MLKKYSPIATLEKFSKATARSLNDLSGKLAVICDTDGVLHAFGEGKREFEGKSLSEEMDRILRDRRSYIASIAEDIFKSNKRIVLRQSRLDKSIKSIMTPSLLKVSFFIL